MIRPAKCHFDGFIKAFIKGADKNHNPRKGTETEIISSALANRRFLDKNHNPRKGTETCNNPSYIQLFYLLDKNHNPRKGTETA